MVVEQAAPVSISHEELWDDACDIDARILEAFGPQGLGLIVIRSVARLPPLREKLLSLASTLATLPASRLASIEDPASGYVVGWSRGVELLEGGKVDDRKGSFYANPMVDAPAAAAAGGDYSLAERLAQQHPAVCRPNVWPSETLPELRPAFCALGGLVVQEGRRLAERCDRALGGGRASRACSGGRVASGETGGGSLSLFDAIQDDATPKARLLHYYARDDVESEEIEGGEVEGSEGGEEGCAVGGEEVEGGQVEGDQVEGGQVEGGQVEGGQVEGGQVEGGQVEGGQVEGGQVENDECETVDGVACEGDPAVFSSSSVASPLPAPNGLPSSVPGSWCGWHSDTGALTGLVSATYRDAGGTVLDGPPDPAAGLHVRRRDGAVVRVSFPADALAFQLGEAAQVLSGGKLRSTPHCVVAGDAGGRNGRVSRQTLAVFLQPRWDVPLGTPPGTAPEAVGVPRWEENIAFGDFAQRRFSDFQLGKGNAKGAEPEREPEANASAAQRGLQKGGETRTAQARGRSETVDVAHQKGLVKGLDGERKDAEDFSSPDATRPAALAVRATRPLAPVENASNAPNVAATGDTSQGEVLPICLGSHALQTANETPAQATAPASDAARPMGEKAVFEGSENAPPPSLSAIC